MKNPWEEIPLSDYENHMKLDTVMQLQAMNTMMMEQFYQYPVRSVLILGIAGGNGLEHINPKKIEKVYGVDINAGYLEACAARYRNLEGILECICADLTAENVILPRADLMVANLLLEYIGYECFSKVVRQVRPQYVSCGIQVNVDDRFVSESPYLHVFDHLDCVLHRIEEAGVAEIMEGMHYQQIRETEKILPNGKKLVRMDFRRTVV